MKTIETNFRDNDSNHTILMREGDVILTRWERDNSKATGFDVMRIRKYPDHTFVFKKGTPEEVSNFSPAHETTPPNTAWGTEGWSFNANPEGESRAMARLVDESAKGPSAIMGEATGKARGRARSEFELDLSAFADKEFEFSDLVSANPDAPEPTLRNRLGALVKDGTVKVVRTISGGRGKPRNVYGLVS